LTESQKRQLSFARAYLQKPKILILDQPLIENDKDYETSFLETVNELREKTTVIITACDVNSIVRQCDRIFVMDSGNVRQRLHKELGENDVSNSKLLPNLLLCLDT
jgi:ABC-type multidrug transport system fused ATPase/permease subunit